MSLELRSLLPNPNSCLGTNPHQQGRHTKIATALIDLVGSKPKPRLAQGRQAPALTRPNQSAICLRQNHSCSFDHLVGEKLQRAWHCEADRFGRLQVDDELELGRSLDREIAGIGTFENEID